MISFVNLGIRLYLRHEYATSRTACSLQIAFDANCPSDDNYRIRCSVLHKPRDHLINCHLAIN